MASQPFKLKFVPNESSQMDLKLYFCGSENCVPSHAVGPSIRDHYKIHYIHSGRGVFRMNGATYTLSAGQGFLIVPDQLAYYKADEADPWSYSWVAFNGLYAEPYMNRAGLSAANPVFACGPALDASIARCFRHMAEARECSASRELRLLGLLYSFLSLVLDASQAGVAGGKAERGTGHYVRQALDFIETNYSDPVSIESLAAELKLSRKYLSRLFKEAVGLPPQDYLIRYRMRKACELMGNPELGIGEISRSVGYSDPLLFSRMFKKLIGASPSLYRKAAAAEAAEL